MTDAAVDLTRAAVRVTVRTPAGVMKGETLFDAGDAGVPGLVALAGARKAAYEGAQAYRRHFPADLVLVELRAAGAAEWVVLREPVFVAGRFVGWLEPRRRSQPRRTVAYLMIRPDGAVSGFTLPSKRQAVAWLIEADRPNPLENTRIP